MRMPLKESSLVEAIVYNQAVCHAYAMRLHGVIRDVGIVAHV